MAFCSCCGGREPKEDGPRERPSARLSLSARQSQSQRASEAVVAAAAALPQVSQDPMICGIRMKWVSLTLLIVQSVVAVLTIRMSTTRAGGMRYLNTTVVFCTEVLKVVVSFLMLGVETGSPTRPIELILQLFGDFEALLRCAVPCVLYVVQNNLLIIALANLSAAEYQVTYQLKILSTALCSLVVLGRKYSLTQWLALMLLTAGVTLIQWRDKPDGDAAQQGSRAIGLTAVLCACGTSGLGGVLMEKLMKRKGVSMWAANLQVAALSAILSLLGALWRDGERIQEKGFFQGYTELTWAVVVVQALGGFIIASVMKYADNILKCFGSALAIVISCLISAKVLAEFQPGGRFVAGTMVVILSIFCYNLGNMLSRAQAEKTAKVA